MKFIGGLLLGLILVPFAVYLYFTSGSAPVATTDSDVPFENFFAHKTLNARIAKDMPKIVPVQATEANYLAGAELYKQHCAVCHGLPLAPRTAIAKGMYPRPPLLFEGKGVTDDEPGESYWKIFNGLRMTGMPGFGEHLGENKTWQVSLLLKNADKISPAVKAELASPSSPDHMSTATPAPPSQSAPASSQPGTTPTPAPATH